VIGLYGLAPSVYLVRIGLEREAPAAKNPTSDTIRHLATKIANVTRRSNRN